MKYRWKIVQREEWIFLSIKVYTFQERQTLGEIEEARANKKLVRTHIYTYIHPVHRNPWGNVNVKRDWFIATVANWNLFRFAWNLPVLTNARFVNWLRVRSRLDYKHNNEIDNAIDNIRQILDSRSNNHFDHIRYVINDIDMNNVFRSKPNLKLRAAFNKLETNSYLLNSEKL